MLKITTSAFLLFSGIAVYWFFRPGIYIFDLLQLTNPEPIVASGVLQLFLKNYFADAAWCAAVFLIAALLRERGSPRVYSSILLMLPFLSEVLQAARLIPGTFDWIDLFIYAILLTLFSYRGVFQMQRTKEHLAGILAITVFAGALVGSAAPPPRPAPTPDAYETGVFTLEQKRDDIFAKPALSRIVRTPKTLAVVLRVPASGEKVTEEQRQQSTILYNTIDKELAKAGYIVRDRALFAKVIDQGNLDYSKIGQLTETDLILELIGFRSEVLATSKYRDESGAEKISPKPIVFSGASIEFKVISVKENDLIGSYVFYHAPCTSGCSHKFSLTVPSSLNASATKVATENVFRDFAVRLVKQLGSSK